jgi:hypothetical protein
MALWLWSGTFRAMKSSKTNIPSRSLRPVTREQIAALAHAIWQDRGCPAGSDLDIWLEAERMLLRGGPARHTVVDDIPADPAHPDRDPAVDGDEIDEELDAIVQVPQQRSATSL